MMEASNNPNNTLIGAFIGLCGMVIAALIRWWRPHVRDREERSVGLATVYSTGIQAILDRYKQEVTDLRTEIKELQNENEKLQQELEKSRDEIDSLQSEVFDLKTTIQKKG